MLQSLFNQVQLLFIVRRFNIQRTSCQLGRSENSADTDLNAYIDEIKLINRFQVLATF